MRAIFVGIEYAGKSTLIELLDAYYRRLRLHPHLDDHFTIPDSELSPESRELALKFPDDVKERTQRMQIHYHVDILKSYEHVLLAGWHIEEAIYTSVYGSDPTSPYYPDYWYHFHRQYEAKLLKEDLAGLILIRMPADDDTIRRRMRDHRHQYQIIRETDIADLKRRFNEEVEKIPARPGQRVHRPGHHRQDASAVSGRVAGPLRTAGQYGRAGDAQCPNSGDGV